MMGLIKKCLILVTVVSLWLGVISLPAAAASEDLYINNTEDSSLIFSNTENRDEDLSVDSGSFFSVVRSQNL